MPRFIAYNDDEQAESRMYVSTSTPRILLHTLRHDGYCASQLSLQPASDHLVRNRSTKCVRASTDSSRLEAIAATFCANCASSYSPHPSAVPPRMQTIFWGNGVFRLARLCANASARIFSDRARARNSSRLYLPSSSAAS